MPNDNPLTTALRCSQLILTHFRMKVAVELMRRVLRRFNFSLCRFSKLLDALEYLLDANTAAAASLKLIFQFYLISAEIPIHPLV